MHVETVQYKTLILPLLLYEFKNWFLVLRMECGRKDGALRNCVGLKDSVIADGRELRDEKLHDFYLSLNIIGPVESRKNRWFGHAARIGRSVMY